MLKKNTLNLSLTNLPAEMIAALGPFLSQKELANMRSSCTFFANSLKHIMIKRIEGLFIKQVVAVGCATLYLRANGSVLGSIKFGKQDYKIPGAIPNLPPIKRILGINYRGCLLVGEDGSIWVFSGLTEDLPEKTQGTETQLIEQENQLFQYASTYSEEFPSDVRVKQIAAGESHVLVLLEDGSVWGKGDNEYNILGLGKELQYHTKFKRIEMPPIKQIAAGEEHSLFLDNDGFVWSCGFPRDGRLGLGDSSSFEECPKDKPALIKGIPLIDQVSAGVAHSILLGKNHSVWGFGNNSYHQLGLGDDKDRRFPEQIMIYNSKLLIDALSLLINRNDENGPKLRYV